MSVWTSEQLARFSDQAEGIFQDENRCLIDRFALNIISGTSLYTLPDQVLDIRRITYRGIKLEPLSHRDMRKYFDGLSSTGTPYNYIFNNVGNLTIKLFPTPVENLANVNTNLFSRSVIQTTCMVEYYTVPDGIRDKLPDFMRRRLLKAFVLKQAFSVEGKGQNLKAAKYWSGKWDYYLEAYGAAVQDIINRPRKLFASNLDYDLIKRLNVAPPVLPINMIGLGVDNSEDDY